MTLRSAVLASTMLLSIAVTDVAAQGRVEIQPFFGGRFGGGFDADAPVAGGFNAVDIDLASGLAWGVTAGVFVSEGVEIEFMLNRQETAIDVEGVKISDAAHTQYHGNFLFHFGESDARVRPYFLFGLGATTLAPDLAGADSVTKFSFGVGGGVKTYFTDNVGLRAQARLTPTYVTDEPAIFCDVFGFCYAVNASVYSYQGEVTVGVSFRF